MQRLANKSTTGTGTGSGEAIAYRFAREGAVLGLHQERTR